MMILDVAEGLAKLVEPDEAINIVVTDVQPLAWLKDTLYAYPMRVQERGIESGPTVRQEFDLRLVLVVGNEGEEARSERDPALARFLDGRAGGYLEAIRRHQTTTLWDHIAAATEKAPATLSNRGAAVRVNGYRVLS